MSIAVKGSIRFKQDSKPSDCPWKIACKPLDIEVDGSGNIDEMIETLTDKVREKLQEEFRTSPRSVMIVGYSISCDFEVIGPVNHALADFGQQYTATVRLGDGTEISMDKLTRTADAVIAYAKKTGKTVDQVLEEAKAELARRKKNAEKGSATS
jgi:hypothetical protein